MSASGHASLHGPFSHGAASRREGNSQLNESFGRSQSLIITGYPRDTTLQQYIAYLCLDHCTLSGPALDPCIVCERIGTWPNHWPCLRLWPDSFGNRTRVSSGRLFTEAARWVVTTEGVKAAAAHLDWRKVKPCQGAKACCPPSPLLQKEVFPWLIFYFFIF